MNPCQYRCPHPHQYPRWRACSYLSRLSRTSHGEALEAWGKKVAALEEEAGDV